MSSGTGHASQHRLDRLPSAKTRQAAVPLTSSKISSLQNASFDHCSHIGGIEPAAV